MIEITSQEKKLLHRVADFFFAIPGINEVQYLSDGIHDTGKTGFLYRPNLPLKDGEVFYTVAVTGTGLHIESEQATELPPSVKEYIDAKFPQANYFRGRNWHHWAGVNITHDSK